MLILVCYDITVTKKRNAIVKFLQKYGTRVQFSVFECDVNSKHKSKLVSWLQNMMDKFNNENGDSIRVYKLCETCLWEVNIIGRWELQIYQEYLIF